MTTKKEFMENAAALEVENRQYSTLTGSVLRAIFLNGWLAAEAYRPVPADVPDGGAAAAEYWKRTLDQKGREGGLDSYALGVQDAFAAGAAWQKERDTRLVDEAINTGLDEQVEAVNVANDAAIERHNELRDALGTISEGMAVLLANHRDLAAAGLRGADRVVAILKHLQEIGDNVRGVSGAIGDKFGVVLDAIKDVGEKVEACMTIASNTEEGLSVSIEKLDKLGVEKWREAIKHVGETTEGYDYSHGIHDDNGNYLPCSKAVYELFVSRSITEPMHAEVKAAGVSRDPMASWDAGKAYARAATECYSKKADESGLGKLWADVPTKLEEVSDETLHELAVSGEISEARYFEEFTRRHELGKPSIGGDGEVKFMGATNESFQAFESKSGQVILLWEGKLYRVIGNGLQPMRFVS